MPHISHKLRLRPNQSQLRSFRRMAGAKRNRFNWALQRWQEMYAAGENPTELKIRKELTQVKKVDEFAWLKEVPQAVTANAVRDLGVAFKNFFRRVKQRATKPGFPRFKRKGLRESFTPTDRKQPIKMKGKRLYIRGAGYVRLCEMPRFEGPVVEATVSLGSCGHWYVALCFEVETIPTGDRVGTGDVGIDLGSTTLATLSDGSTFAPEKQYKRQDKRLKRLQRRLAKQQKPSNRRARTKSSIGKILAGQRRRRNEYLHELTTGIVRTFDRISIEDLNVRGMVKLRSLARSISDRAFREFRRQVEYKAKWYGCYLHVVDRFFPSSKLCSACGCKKDDLSLSDRTYECDACGLTIDRDLNAALNLKDQIPVLAPGI